MITLTTQEAFDIAKKKIENNKKDLEIFTIPVKHLIIIAKAILTYRYMFKNPAYVTGFFDGEGTFFTDLRTREAMKLNYQLIPEIAVGQNEIDIHILVALSLFFGGAGRIDCRRKTKQSSNQGVLFGWVIRNGQEVKRIIDFFKNQYPLQTKRKAEIVDFDKLFTMYLNKEHLEIKGLYKCALIIEKMARREIKPKKKEQIKDIKDMYLKWLKSQKKML